MRKYTLIPFVLISIVACNTSPKKLYCNFKEVEISYFNGWKNGQTIHLDSLGKVIKCVYKYDSVAECYSGSLTSNQMDTVILKVMGINTSNTDSLYDGFCGDCGICFIKIIEQRDTIKSMIIGPDKFTNSIAVFSRYLSTIKVKLNKIDSCYKFETWKINYPPKLKSK